MTVNAYIKTLVLVIRRKITDPLLITCNCIWYIFLELSFGHSVAHNYLSSIGPAAITTIIRLRGGVVGRGTVIQSGVRFHNCRTFSNLTIGDNCQIGKDVFMDLRGKINIGNNVVIAMRALLITHFDMSNSHISHLFPSGFANIDIGSNSYLGAGVTILMGVKIEQSCVIGAHSLVIKSTEGMSVYAGAPAKRLRSIS